MQEIGAKISVRPSRFGKGVFASRTIEKGERILEFTGSVITLEEALQKPVEKRSYPLQIGEKEYRDLEEPSSLVNHSCNPSAGILDDRFLVALRQIEKDEEIFYDYSTTMDEDNWTMECHCSEVSCRRTVADFHHLPSELQTRYLGLNVVQSFIEKKFAHTGEIA